MMSDQGLIYVMSPRGRLAAPNGFRMPGSQQDRDRRRLVDVEAGQAPRALPWLAARNKCLAQNNKSCTGTKPTKK